MANVESDRASADNKMLAVMFIGNSGEQVQMARSSRGDQNRVITSLANRVRKVVDSAD